MQNKKWFVLLCVVSLLINLFAVGVGAETTDTVTLYEGETVIPSAWTMGPAVYTIHAGGTFNPSVMEEGGCLAVYYTGTRGSLYLAVMDSVDWVWKQTDAPTSTDSADGGHVSYFSYDDCVAMYGKTDFSDLGAVIIGSAHSTEEIVITKILWMPMPEEEVPEKSLAKTVLWEDSLSITEQWTLGPSVYTTNSGGSFDPGEITEDGYFEVTYSGTSGAVYLALADWDTSLWASANYPTSTVANDDGSYTSTFDFYTCSTAYGSEDMSATDAICVGTTSSSGETVITSIVWYGYTNKVDLGETDMLFSGSVTATTKGSHLTFFYTKHVGGEWDGSKINEGSYFYVEYAGAKDGIFLAFVSVSGATQWVAVYPDDTGVNAAGYYYSIYSYDNFSKAFGTNFVRLDQIQVYSAKNEAVTLKRIAYFEGEGDPVDNSDPTWDKPDTGIAFIGDSIVHNPLCDGTNLGNIDWNGILGRTDCANYGIGGQTTKECLARIDELAKKDYDKLVILCGINDIGRGHTNEQIVSNYSGMIDAMKANNPDIQVFIISVLPTESVYYTNMQHKIVELNAALEELAESLDNVQFVDCYSSFVGEDSYCKAGLTFDGLHPNLDGYAIIADILNPYLEGEVTEQVIPEHSEGTESTEATVTTEPTTSGNTTADTNNDSQYIWIIVVAALAVVAVAIVIVKKGKK